MSDEEREDLLAQQLTMTRVTWDRLVAHGVTESTQLSLDFSYRAPSYERANDLKRFLEDEADYRVRVVAVEERWRVSGVTQPTPVTLPILEEWVDWMVAAGSQFDCEFDGWGTEVP
jgi:hypothetical protein